MSVSMGARSGWAWRVRRESAKRGILYLFVLTVCVSLMVKTIVSLRGERLGMMGGNSCQTSC